MVILGIHGDSAFEVDDNAHHLRGHDSAAVLLGDGEILAAIEEERLARVKHCNAFPRRAIRRCLEMQRLCIGDIDHIAVNMDGQTAELAAAARYLNHPATTSRDAVDLYGQLFRHEFGVDVSHKLRFCNHHVAHAWSAYGPSGFDDALVVVFDGEGDHRSGGVFTGANGRLVALRDYGVEQSLGHFYTSVIRLLGYNEFDQYKAMGLAPYGDPQAYEALFAGLYQLLPDGNFHLAAPVARMRRFEQAGLLEAARRRGEPFSQRHKDVAAALQQMLETVVLHVLGHFRTSTGLRNLCLAGGVAHNCSANAKVLGSGLFERMFVQPAAHDAGGALGAAWFVQQGERERRVQPLAPSPATRLRHLALGSGIGGDSALERSLTAWDRFVRVERSADCRREAAAAIAEGQVIGWVQGRSEFGPRALGQRSILADPRPAWNKQRINDLVKTREAYRPFAPSVPVERLHDYFEVPQTEADLSFMTYVLRVREDRRALLGAVTHVDGTARVQTVLREQSPLYWELIEEFGHLTRVPILLNTSFNNNAEPIVDSADDALACFLTTRLDALWVGNYQLRKRHPTDALEAHESLVLSLPLSRKLVRAHKLSERGSAQPVFRIDGTMSRFFARPSAELTPELWRALLHADGQRPVADLLDMAGLHSREARDLAVEQILALWARRFVRLSPRTGDGTAP